VQLKDYQNRVLEDLSRYLRTLTVMREDAEEVFRILREKGREAKLGAMVNSCVWPVDQAAAC